MKNGKLLGHGDQAGPKRTYGGWFDDEHCVMCGRKIGKNPLWVHFVNGWDEIYSASAPEPYTDAGADMGWWPVGSECAKRFETGVLHRREVA